MQKPADFRMPQCDPAQLPQRLNGYRDDYAHGLSCNGRSMRFRSIREAGWPAARGGLLQAAILFEQLLGLDQLLPVDPKPGTVPPTI
jgi:hypothetical protein